MRSTFNPFLIQFSSMAVLVLASTSFALGQIDDSKYYQTVQILQPQVFTLNSTLRSIVGGVNTTSVDINLPQNTVKWYYSFSSFPIEQKPGSTNLFAEITTLVLGGQYANLVEALTKPTGVNVCNLTLQDGGYTRSDGSRKMYNSGIVEIEPKYSLSQRITFENPNTTEAIKIQIEAVAITLDRDQIQKDKEAQAQEDLNKSIEDLGNAISDLSEASKAAKEKKLSKEKEEMANFMSLGYKKLDRQDFQGAISIFSEATKEKNYFVYVAYQGLGTAYRYNKEYEKAITAYQRSIKENKKDENMIARCHGGIGLTYLLKGEELRANKSYLEALKRLTKDQAGQNEKTLMISAIQKAIESSQNQLPGSADIIELLSN